MKWIRILLKSLLGIILKKKKERQGTNKIQNFIPHDIKNNVFAMHLSKKKVQIRYLTHSFSRLEAETSVVYPTNLHCVMFTTCSHGSLLYYVVGHVQLTRNRGVSTEVPSFPGTTVEGWNWKIL